MTREGNGGGHDPPSGAVRRAATIGLVVGIPASLVFLWLAFRDASVDEVREAALEADPALMLLAIASFAGLYAFQGARWRVIAEPRRTGLLALIEMVVGAVACNNVLPGRIGELFRARWLAVAEPMSSGRALATVGLDRGADVLTLFAFLAVSLPFVASTSWVLRIALGAVALIAVLVVLLLGARLYAGSRRRDRRARGRMRRIARDVVDTLAEPLGRRRVARALGLSMVAWGWFALAVWLVARSLGLELDPIDCVFVTGVLNLGVAIPSSPGFVGTYQWLAVAALGVLDIGRENALAFSILLQASWYVPTTLVGGFLVLFRLDWGLRGRG